MRLDLKMINRAPENALELGRSGEYSKEIVGSRLGLASARCLGMMCMRQGFLCKYVRIRIPVLASP